VLEMIEMTPVTRGQAQVLAQWSARCQDIYCMLCYCMLLIHYLLWLPIFHHTVCSAISTHTITTSMTWWASSLMRWSRLTHRSHRLQPVEQSRNNWFITWFTVDYTARHTRITSCAMPPPTASWQCCSPFTSFARWRSCSGITISSYLFARWHLFRHVGYLRHQQQVDLWPFDLESGVRVTCDVGYLCGNFSLPRPLCSPVRPDVRDRETDVRHTSDVRQKPLWGRRHNKYNRQ